MKQKAPFWFIINNLSYVQTYLLVCFIFFLALIPTAYFWIQTHLNHIKLLNMQIQEIDYERDLKQLLTHLQKHRVLAYYLLNGQSHVKADLETTQQAINEIFQKLSAHLETLNGEWDSLSNLNSSNWHKEQIQDLYNHWHLLRQKLTKDLSSDQSFLLHTQLIQSLQTNLSHLNNKVRLFYASSASNYFVLETIFWRFPILQENIANLAIISQEAIDSHTIDQQRISMRSLISAIESDMSFIRKKVEIASTFLKADINQNLINIINDYQRVVDDFLQFIEVEILDTRESRATSTQIANLSENALTRSSRIWDQGLDLMKQLVESEKSYWLYRFWGIVLFTLAILALAFIVGLIIIYTASNRLSYLTQATNSFTNGNLSIRVPITYQDEIGRQSQAFNRMAQKLEEIINHLYELLDATTALANGNLATRIQIKNHHTEFDKVALSFNKMAETFESIIGRLQQLSLILTTSASEIAAASKEQETIIVEQEATTREIAVAANEISATAKEFATTMNEVSQSADQTSSIALTGKTSLTNMETAMRQMVDSSGNIAAKLAVLNEKAGNITSVITTITKVADQTNLLSLNASIEAEKAGEYGRSFAVIAREIRRLADQTAIATLDIEKMVNEIMLAVSSSVMGMDDFTQEIRNGVDQVKSVSGQLAKIIEQVQAFTARFDMVNQGMQTQSTGAEQINEAISQLSQTAQQTTESIHQFHKTIQELNNAANDLKNLSSPLIKFSTKQEPSLPGEDLSFSQNPSIPQTMGDSTISRLKNTY